MSASDLSMRRMTGFSALISVALWLAIFPLYTMGDPPVSLHDGAAIARDFSRIQNVVLTRILLGLALYPTLLVFAVGLRELIRRADAQFEWVGTLLVASMTVWLAVTLVANGIEGGIVLDALHGSGDPSVARALTMAYLLIYNGAIAFVVTALFLATAGYATFVTGILPRWTAWLACAAALLCVACIPAMYAGSVDPAGFYNAGGWGAALIANFPPLLWFLAVGALLVRRR
ncbi:MAG TPA: hypothetical protein VHP33_06575 [Polyangiaceae bacterium]|nr:hypothetical protein [Polyangiaceae bacterium]